MIEIIPAALWREREWAYDAVQHKNITEVAAMNKPTEFETLREAARLARFYGRPELAQQIEVLAYESHYAVVEVSDELAESDSDSDLQRAAGYGGGAGLETVRVTTVECPSSLCANDSNDQPAGPCRAANGWWE